MIHRIALLAGAFAATGILAFAAGNASTPPAVDPAPAADVVADPVAAISVPAPVPPVVRTETDTVYVAPVPEPAVVNVTRQAPPVDVAPVPRAAPAQPRASEREREHEGGDEAEDEGSDD